MNDVDDTADMTADVKVEMSRADGIALLRLLETSPANWPSVIPSIRHALGCCSCGGRWLYDDTNDTTFCAVCSQNADEAIMVGNA